MPCHVLMCAVGIPPLSCFSRGLRDHQKQYREFAELIPKGALLAYNPVTNNNPSG